MTTPLLDEFIPTRKQELRIADDERLYFIGDIHGCYSEFVDLVSKCRKDAGERGKRARIIQLGDLIDRGPYLFIIFEYIDQHDDVDFISGNHEYNFYAEQLGLKKCNSRARLENHGKFSFLDDESKEKIMSMIANSLTMVYGQKSDGSWFIGSHSIPTGFENTLNFSKPMLNIENHGFSLFSRSEGPEYDILGKRFNSGNDKLTLFHGHQSWRFVNLMTQSMEQRGNNVRIFNLDSGCVYGDTLTAVCVNDDLVIHTKAKKQYFTKRK